MTSVIIYLIDLHEVIFIILRCSSICSSIHIWIPIHLSLLPLYDHTISPPSLSSSPTLPSSSSFVLKYAAPCSAFVFLSS
mmetsp:Transcript_23028/g.32895  ORF Transcript_23028/g.32895 Transcript_23028/m.32895 type:complete len:80 (-) Transcript_23028:410-649(-)